MDKEWFIIYYSDKDGLSPVQEYIDHLSPGEQAKILSFIGLLAEKGSNLHRPYADLLKDGIHELRIKLTGTQVRTLYFFVIKILLF